jgi:protein-S-isoprenylcysteine O-methyltransferase Ste14
MKSPVEVFFSVTTGPEHRRKLLTPVGLLVFTALLLLPVFLSLLTDRVLGLPRLLPGALGWAVGVPLLTAGGLLWGWCVVLFWKARGTPVPFNPPRELVIQGPYAWMRNPMLTGVFACLFGLGFCLHSLSMVVVWTPLFVLANAIELKLVEEPELERRIGPTYSEYRRRVPMFVPRLRRAKRED